MPASAHFNGFKLGTSAHVLFLLDIYHLRYIAQPLHFHYVTSELKLIPVRDK